MAALTPRVLSIQSHVVRGYAGNRCAVFPLQTLGFEVDFIDSVNFSNHTGYPVVKGTEVTGGQLNELYQGLKSNKVADYNYLLTGFVSRVDFLGEVVNIVKDLKQNNQNVTYVCDPVLGDDGKYYVNKDLTKIYKNLLLPLCDILTPNQFELGELTAKPVGTEDDLLEAISCLHDMGVPEVVVTSASFADREHELFCYISRKKGSEVRSKYKIRRVPGVFVGTGDLVAALILAWTAKELPLDKAVDKAINTVQAILADTNAFSELLKESKPFLCPAARLELRLVENREVILRPPICLQSVPL